jgi:Guanylate-binding protein, N-terminal domain
MGEAADNKFFAFLFLISSLLIYNSEGKISDNSVFGMRMVNHLSEIFQVADDRE